MTDYRYASGEEPRAGDVVRSLKDAAQAPRKIGDVFTIHRLGSFNVWYDRHINGKAESFELIARAGEPVRYQPGDVVELVSPSAIIVPSRYSTIRREIGYRYTLCDPAYAPNGGGNLHYVDAYNGGGKTWAPPSYFKLVHRPAKTEPLVFAPPEPQVGDRVRVTVEGTVRDLRATGMFIDEPGSTSATRVGLHADYTVEIIERAEKPLAVGDEVAYPATPPIGRIRSIDEGKAWVWMHQGNGHRTIELRSLVRVKR